MKKMLFTVLVISSISYSQNFGTWTQTDSLSIPREQGASVALADGNVLVSGGIDSLGIRSAQIFDYLTEKWTLINPMVKGRSYFKLARLYNGNVLAIGGEFGTKSCEIYDTTSKTWSLTDSLNYQRTSDETITILDDGNVLVTAGYYLSVGKFGPLGSCEIYNPNTAKWSITDSLKIVRDQHTATKLLDGRVLVAGGNSYSANGELTDCEIYDPQTGKWSVAAPLNIARYAHSATLLADGKVLVTGGENYTDLTSPWLNSCEIYDPGLNTWTIVDSLLSPRAFHSGVLLKKGLLLVFGGGFGSESWELYNPNDFSNVYLGIYPYIQGDPLINLLPNGKILSAGGVTSTDSTGILVRSPTSICYLYDPEGINGIREQNNNLVKSFRLYQNYPNPFNPSTTIKYDLQTSSHILIKVYNSLGKEIVTLINKTQPSGSHTINFNSKDLPSGVYFYQIISGNWTQTKKMLVIK